MNKTGKIVLGTIAAIGLMVNGVAMAHNPDDGRGPGMMCPGMMGPGMMGRNNMGGMHCDREARAAEHLSSVKEQLKLTDEQTGAWQAFETAVTSQMANMPKGHHDRSGKMEDHIAFMEQRLAGMKTVLKARNDLYAVLTPEQKTTAGQLLQHGSHMGHHQ